MEKFIKLYGNIIIDGYEIVCNTFDGSVERGHPYQYPSEKGIHLHTRILGGGMKG